MARLACIAKQKRRERQVGLKWDKRAQLKAIVKSHRSSEEEKENAMIALNKMPRNSSSVRLRNRCQVTGRSRGYLRKFKLSRLCFREMANSGMIPGMFKASW